MPRSSGHLKTVMFGMALLAGCSRNLPQPAPATAGSVNLEAVARALASELRPRARTFLVDMREQVSGRTRCALDVKLRCPDIDRHAEFTNALAAQLGGKVVNRSVESRCPGDASCLESRDAMIVRISIPVVDSSGRIEIDISTYVPSQDHYHGPGFVSFLLECSVDSCIVVSRKRNLTH